MQNTSIQFLPSEIVMYYCKRGIFCGTITFTNFALVWVNVILRHSQLEN